MHKLYALNKEIAKDACENIEKRGFSRDCFERMSQALDNMKDIVKIEKYGVSEREELHDEMVNIIDDISTCYRNYVRAKGQYKLSRMDSHKRDMLNYLSQMFDAHTAAMAEIKKCVDCEDERRLIAEKVK